MNKLFMLILMIFAFSFTSVYAKKGKPVAHKHGNRSHTHPLPATGVNHSHGKNNNTAPARTNWVYIGRSTTNNLFEAKPGSLEITRNKGGKPIAVIIGQIIDGKTKSVSIYQWYVSISDCKHKMGKLVALNMKGQFQFDSDFVLGGASMGSTLADRICVAYDYNQAEKYKKGR